MKTALVSARVCLAAILATAGGMAVAQDAAGPIRIIQGFAPGGGHDTVARLLAPRVGAHLKVQSIVEARPGANGIIAAESVARAAPDGNTVLLSGVSTFVQEEFARWGKVVQSTGIQLKQ
ncbi:MAG: hypothetical protein IT529_09525 [Burkholderiales bacterium]|nr:hypothetical protein [Burkholderiales bacterium]